MKTLLGSVAIGLGALLCQGAYAQDSTSAASAPHTAQCKDGTYYDGTTHKGACKGHQGVKEWLDKSKTAAAGSDTTDTAKKHHKKDTATAASTTATPAATTSAPAATGTAAAKSAPTPAKDIVAKPGGGAGLVWVNTDTKVYHCQGDQWYGKTKEGSYMSVADAEKAGAHPSNGKACK